MNLLGHMPGHQGHTGAGRSQVIGRCELPHLCWDCPTQVVLVEIAAQREGGASPAA